MSDYKDGTASLQTAQIERLKQELAWAGRIYTREELLLTEQMNGRTLDVWLRERDQLRAKLARVEALLTRWRLNHYRHDGVYASELEAALRDEGE